MAVRKTIAENGGDFIGGVRNIFKKNLYVKMGN